MLHIFSVLSKTLACFSAFPAALTVLSVVNVNYHEYSSVQQLQFESSHSASITQYTLLELILGDMTKTNGEKLR